MKQKPFPFTFATLPIASKFLVSLSFKNIVIVQFQIPSAGASVPQGNVVQPGTTITSPPTLPGGTSTVNIPGIGTVQILNTATPQLTIPSAAPLAQGAQVLQTAQGQQVSIPSATQPAFQQAYQQDPNDPSKWHVVQVATAPSIQPIQVATAAGAIQGGISTAASIINNQLANVGQGGVAFTGGAIVRRDQGNSSTVPSSSGAQSGAKVITDANGQPVKTRLRRVACTCPNCKDGDRSRNK